MASLIDFILIAGFITAAHAQICKSHRLPLLGFINETTFFIKVATHTRIAFLLPPNSALLAPGAIQTLRFPIFVSKAIVLLSLLQLRLLQPNQVSTNLTLYIVCVKGGIFGQFSGLQLLMRQIA